MPKSSDSSTPLAKPLPQRWRIAQRAYALGAVLLMLLSVTTLHGEAAMTSRSLLELLCLAILLAIIIVLAFRLAHRAALDRVAQMQARISAALKTLEVPDLPHDGWQAFDDLADAITLYCTRAEQQVQALSSDVNWYRQLAEDSLGIEAYFSGKGRLLWLNPATERITGYSLEDCFAAGDIVDLWVYAKDRPLMKELARRGLAGEEREEHELRIQSRDGGLGWFSCRWRVNRDETGRIVGLRFSAQDIQRRKDAELKLLETVAALRRTQALKEHYLNRSNDEKMRLSSLLDTVAQGILFVDRDRRIVYINQPAVDLWRLDSRDSVVGTRDATLIEQTFGMRIDEEAYAHYIEEVILSRQNSLPRDIELRDGRIIRHVSAIVPSSDGSRPIGRVWVFEDVTDARSAQQRLTELAERDPLTGLYNRRRFMEEMERHLADSARRGEQVGLLSFDLDGFKFINDTYGHQAGDEVLIRLCQEIGSIVRRNELFFRLGGDEFAILVASTDTESMEQLARRVLSKAQELHFDFGDGRASITLSIGVATAPVHATTLDGLIAVTDRAMYRAKALGKNRCEIAASSL
ncbi:diguanylate cyclase [Uliginosibacterium sediminicola]|uniref:Diguanylate cyclase n=1 Tax=Uliginosibacterium sediminicola TaxID=2024550 RepID=A0ABU9YXF5_9RHOO